MKKKEIRRYNFIAGTTRVYSGLFEKVGFFGGIKLQKDLVDKRIEIAVKYGIPLKMIAVSGTIKD
jgi:hypothetical protein